MIREVVRGSIKNIKGLFNLPPMVIKEVKSSENLEGSVLKTQIKIVLGERGEMGAEKGFILSGVANRYYGKENLLDSSVFDRVFLDLVNGREIVSQREEYKCGYQKKEVTFYRLGQKLVGAE